MREWDFAGNKKGITKYCQQDGDLIYITIFRFSRCYERLLQEVVMKRAINELSRKAIRARERTCCSEEKYCKVVT